MSLRPPHLSSCPLRLFMAGLIICVWTLPCNAQELQPRRWGHLPIGTNALGGSYSYTKADIAFNPVLLIEDGELEMQAVGFKYIRAFELLGKTTRFSITQGYVDATWTGILDGEPASAYRAGLSDTTLRISSLLYGAPPLKGKDFKNHRASVADCETIIGAGLAIHLPTGYYEEDRLVNFGTNRFTFRPQLGVVHSRGKWAAELTGSVWLFTDNTDFFGGKQLENDPLYTIQGHFVYTFRPGLSLAAGLAYGYGGKSTLDGERKNDEKENLLWGTSLNIPINPKTGISITYVGSQTQKDTGADSNTIALGMSFLW